MRAVEAGAVSFQAKLSNREDNEYAVLKSRAHSLTAVIHSSVRCDSFEEFRDAVGCRSCHQDICKRDA
jgi:hypothetical protein